MSQIQMNVPDLTKINKFLIISHVVLFLLTQTLRQLAGIDLIGILGMNAPALMSGHLYQALTYFLVEASFFSMLFNCLLLWFIGGELELKWGRRIYLQFLAVSILTGALAYSLFAIFFSSSFVPLYGLNGIILSLLLAYGIVYSDRVMSFMLIFPMKAKYFCALIAGVELYMAIFSPMAKVAWCHLVAMAASFVFLKYKSLASQGWTFSKMREHMEFEKKKKKLTLIKNDDENGPKWH